MWKKISILVLVLLFISIPMEAKVRVTFMGQEMKDFWRGNKFNPIMYTVCAAGCMYGGYTVLTKAENKGFLGYTAGTMLFLGGFVGVSISLGFDFYSEQGKE